MGKSEYKWESVNWLKQDVVISRELNCSRERVRQKRKLLGKSKSPDYHKHDSVVRTKLMALNTKNMTIEEITAKIKCSKCYALNLINSCNKEYKKFDKRTIGKYDWSNVNWEDTDKDIASRLGINNLGVVTQRRRRMGIFKERRNSVFVLTKKSLKNVEELAH